MYFSYSVIKEEGPDNDQDKEPSDRTSEEPEAVRLIYFLFHTSTVKPYVK